MEPSRAAAKNHVAFVSFSKGSTALKLCPLLVEIQTLPNCPVPVRAAATLLPSGVETILAQVPLGILEGDDANQFLPRLVVCKSFPLDAPATILSPTFGVVLLIAIPE